MHCFVFCSRPVSSDAQHQPFALQQQGASMVRAVGGSDLIWGDSAVGFEKTNLSFI